MEDGFLLGDSTVGIIGLGLMGGSLAMRLKGKCTRLIGFDSHLPMLELALSKGIIDHAGALSPSPCEASPKGTGRGARGVGEVDVLILATPVPSILNIIHQLSRSIPSEQSTNYQAPITLLDLGSTKRDITQAMSELPENFDPIGGHPICGREKLGLENADPNLYRDAPFVITPLERTSQRAKSAARQLISAVGAHLIEMTAEEHDRILASTSHLPFLIASALVHSTPQEFASLIGPGFRSTSRLAGTPSHMMLGILQSNRDNLLDAIQSFRNSLAEIESTLQDENYSQLELILNQSRASYSSLTDN